MENRSRDGLGAALAALILVAGSASAALAASIDFEAEEGYVVDVLQGQPTTGNQWVGDITSKIVVTSEESPSGDQSVLIDPGGSSGKVNNELDVGGVPTRFSLKFYWRPSGITSGEAVVYLSQFAGSETTFTGPFVSFVASGSVYQIKYVENGAVGNIKLGMSRSTYENRWWEVEIIGDLSTRTFDFYLDGIQEGSDLGFRNTLTNLATSLDFVGLQASVSGSSDHSFDHIRIDPQGPAVPIASGWGVFVLFILLSSVVAWQSNRSRSDFPDALPRRVHRQPGHARERVARKENRLGSWHAHCISLEP